MATREKSCRLCGGLFKPRTWNQIYCPGCLADPEKTREIANLRKKIARARRRSFEFKKCRRCGKSILDRGFSTANLQGETPPARSGQAGNPDPEPTSCKTRKACPDCGRTFRCRSNRQVRCVRCREKAKRKSKTKGATKGRGPRRPPDLKAEKKCASCGRRFAPASNRQLWCPLCRVAAERERNRRKVAAWRRRKKCIPFTAKSVH